MGQSGSEPSDYRDRTETKLAEPSSKVGQERTQATPSAYLSEQLAHPECIDEEMPQLAVLCESISRDTEFCQNDISAESDAADDSICTQTASYSGGANANGELELGAILDTLCLQVSSLSGDIMFGPVRTSVSMTVWDLAQALLKNKEDDRLMPLFTFDNVALYNTRATIFSLTLTAERRTEDMLPLNFQVIWQTQLQQHDFVRVCHDLEITVMYKPIALSPGHAGKVLNVQTFDHDGSSGTMAVAPSGGRKPGDVLIHFEAVGNAWVARCDQCKLSREESPCYGSQT